MARLEIRLLGPFDVNLDGEKVTEFESDSARALLAYLAADPGQASSRAVLAEMLWPERPPGAALSNLRHVLSVVRRALGVGEAGGHWLLADRSTVAVADSVDVWVDLADFEVLASTPTDQPGAVEAWQRAVDLWRGPFLEGLSVRTGAEWEEWQVIVAERARGHLVAALRHLADHRERAGDWERVIPITRRLIEADPWEERAHRQLMRVLARTGEGALALSHYADLQEQLERDLGTAPTVETVALMEQIRTGEISRAVPEMEIAYPDFLTSTRPPVPSSLFAGRGRELEGLSAHLEATLAGRGRIVLLAGEAGSGKTMLAREFMRHATEVPDLLVARGRCNAYGGLGDPYLPFREILGMFTGDVEAGLSAGAIDREQATRLWEAIPLTARLLSERGPSLVGIMLNGGLLLQRAEQASPGAEWLRSLGAHVHAMATLPPTPERVQPALFDEYTAVLEGIAAVHPLVWLIDDLQWADQGSIALLWHLARRVEGQRILIIGAYRPEEITGEEGQPHPLEPVLGEVRSALPDCTIELGTDRGFIDEFIDSEPNDLDTGFRDRLFSYTNGHPLYTVEMVRGMQERAEIRRSQAGVWTAQESLDWDRLPTRLEAVIAQRVARLPRPLQQDLMVGAVQGEEFIAETVATVRGDPEVPARLSRESTSPQRLTDPASVTRIDGRLAARHRFRHILFQRYLYERLEQAERIRLHEITGRALEDLYRDHPEPPIVDLAYHFDAAGLVEPTIGYLHRAGQRAMAMSANEEAIRLLERAAELLMTLPESAGRDERELALLVSLAVPVMTVRGPGTPEAEQIGNRVWDLCDRLDPSPMGAMALIGLASALFMRGHFAEGAAASRKALAIAGLFDDPALRVLAGFELGVCLYMSGDLTSGHEHMKRAHELHDPERDVWLMQVFGREPAAEALVWDAVNTWTLGYPEQALTLADQGIALARRLDHPWTLCHALAVGGATLRSFRGEYREALAFIDELEAIASREHLHFWSAPVGIYRGIAVGHLGDPDAGIKLVTHGLAWWQAMGSEGFQGFHTAHVAELEHLRGCTDRALELVDQALSGLRATGGGLNDVIVAVHRSALLRASGDPSAVEALEAAIESSRSIGARSYELRAATQLAILFEEQHRPADARRVLAPVYDWFTEGFDTADLVAAREVLERL